MEFLIIHEMTLNARNDKEIEAKHTKNLAQKLVLKELGSNSRDGDVDDEEYGEIISLSK